MSAPQPGDRVSNYLLEVPIGTGSFGQVWRAKHHMFDDLVAIKVPTDADYVQNLRREGVVIHGLRHPNIVRAIDLDPYGDPPYLIMELVAGDSLRAFIDAHPKGLPIQDAQAVMCGMLRALEVAHEAGVIHRDVKPANILLTRRVGDPEPLTEQCVKVADFGLGSVGGVTTHSIMQSGSMLTERGKSISGTLAYMAPEQKEGSETDARADLYSCGIVLFEMLTGQRPHGAEFPSGLRSDVPASLDEVFRKCYVRWEHRYTCASEMLHALSGSAIPFAKRVRTDDGPSCPSCRRDVQRDDQFCVHCGFQIVPSVPRCQACDAFVNAVDRFCIFCGNDLRVKVG